MSKNFSYIPFMSIDDHLNEHYCEHESLTPDYSNENIVAPLNKLTKQKKNNISIVDYHF
jgi:hypothetical protein